MPLKLTNNATSTLASTLSDSATSLQVQADDAGKFPSLGAGEWFPVVVVDGAGNMEIMKCTARTGATLTVVRAQEGTAAQEWDTGARVDSRFTAGAFSTMYDDIQDDIEDIQQAVADAGWATFPIGVPLPIFSHITGISLPAKDQAYRYVLLTAGEDGSGEYNEGILTSESVSGSSPEVSATAVISLSGSPINGQTIRLINSERRFLRAGLPGTLQDSANKQHNHTGSANSAGAHTHQTQFGTASNRQSGSGDWNNVAQTGSFGANTSSAGAHTHTLTIDNQGESEARARNIGVDYIMRIK